MKRIPLCFILLLPQFIFAQGIQRGTVVLQSSGRKPLPQVQLLVSGAAPTTTDNAGVFSLTLPKHKVGEMIFVEKISKKDYAVVNKKQVEQLTFSPQKEFEVVMCLASQLQANIERYYQIGDRRYQMSYEKVMTQITQEKEAGKINEQERIDKLAQAYDQFQKEMELLQDYSDLFARINKDDLTAVEVSAFEFLDKGDIDGAIAVYEKAKFMEKFIEQNQITARANDEITKLIPSLKNYADMCIFAGGKKNYERAGDILRTIALSDTTNINRVIEYVVFASAQENLPEAVKFVQIAVNAADISKNAVEYFSAFTCKARIHSQHGEFKIAAEICKKLLPKARELAKTNTDWLPTITWIFNELFYNYSMTKDYASARKIVAEALELSRSCAEKWPDKCTNLLARATQNMGRVLSRERKYDKAERNFKESIELYKLLAKDNSGFYGSVAGVHLLRAELYTDMQEYSKVDSIYVEAFDLLDAQIKRDTPGVANWYVNLMTRHARFLYEYTEDFARAEKICDTAIEFARPLLLKSPTIYGVHMYNLLHWKAGCCIKTEKYELADSLLSETAELYKNRPDKSFFKKDAEYEWQVDWNYVEKLNEDKIRSYIANEDYLAAERFITKLKRMQRKRQQKQEAIVQEFNHFDEEIYAKLQADSTAEQKYQTALANFKELAKKDSIQYMPLVAETFHSMGFFYNRKGEREAAREAYGEAFDIKSDIFDKNPDEFTLADFAITAVNLAIVYHAMGYYQEAETVYDCCLEFYETLNEINPNSYAQYIPNIHHLIGLMYVSQNSFPVAKMSFNKALEIRIENAKSNKGSCLDVIISLNSLGELYAKNDYDSEALTCYEQVVAWYEFLSTQTPGRDFKKEQIEVVSKLINIQERQNKMGKAQTSREYLKSLQQK